MEKNSYSQIDSGKTFMWALLLPQVVSFVIALVISMFYGESTDMSNSLFYNVVLSMLAQVCFIFVFFYYNKKNKINFINATKLNKKINIKNVIFCLLISVIAVFGLMNFISIFDKIFQKIGILQNPIKLPDKSFGWFIYKVIILALLPAVFEELIFRGMIFGGLRSRGFWSAGLISALMFAVMHLSVYQLVYPFIMGIVFALVFEKTGSIKYSMLVHFGNNFIVLLISYINALTGKTFASVNVNTIPKALLFTAIATVALVAIWFIIKKCLKKEETEVQCVPEVNYSFAQKQLNNKFVFGALAIGAGLWVLMLILSIV